MAGYNSTLCDGLQCDVFKTLTHDQKVAMRTLLSRVSESAYRRGVQQGMVYTQNWGGSVESLHTKMYAFRYDHELDVSPNFNDSGETTSVDRFNMEYGLVIRDLGL